MTNFSVSSFQPMGCYSLMAKYNSQKGWLPYWAHALGYSQCNGKIDYLNFVGKRKYEK